MARVPAGLDNDEARDRMADKMHREEDRTLTDAEIAANESNLQNNDREREDELNRLRDEYDKHKRQTEQQLNEMSETLRDTTARYQQVLEEKKRLTELYGSISAESNSGETGKKGEEERVRTASPECLTGQNPRGDKRKRPDVNLPRFNRMARSPTPHPRAARTASASRSGSSGGIRRRGLDGGKGSRTGNTGKKEIRSAKLAKDIKKRGAFLYHCGICQEQLGGLGRADHAVRHMLGSSKHGAHGPCAKWRTGTLSPQDRQDYLLGKYPRRGVRYVKYTDGGGIAEQGYKDWTLQMATGRGVVIVQRDRAEAEAARQAMVRG